MNEVKQCCLFLAECCAGFAAGVTVIATMTVFSAAAFKVAADAIFWMFGM